VAGVGPPAGAGGGGEIPIERPRMRMRARGCKARQKLGQKRGGGDEGAASGLGRLRSLLPYFPFSQKKKGLPALAESHTISNFIEFHENITVFMIYYVENIFQPKFNDTNFVA
jgi:hypothetical protein